MFKIFNKQWEPKAGKRILVRDSDHRMWVERIFLFKKDEYFYCLIKFEEKIYLSNKHNPEIITSNRWSYCKELKEVKEQVGEIFGEKFKRLLYSNKTLYDSSNEKRKIF